MRDHIKMPQKVCIIGLGQMGGSIAFAAKKYLSGTEVIGYSLYESEIQQALDLKAVDRGTTNIAEALKDVDLCILALPIEPLIQFVKDNIEHFPKGCIVTDISSVKSLIINKIKPLLNDNGIHFIGSHPMAGSEKSGLINADADLYLKNVIFICGFCTDDPAAINIVREFWREIGGTPYEVDAVAHDAAVASTSHTLHITSAIAAHVALEGEKYDLAKLACAGAFRDTTRIAASDPKMWREITIANRDAIAVNQAYHGFSGSRFLASNDTVILGPVNTAAIAAGMDEIQIAALGPAAAPSWQYLWKPMNGTHTAVLLMNSGDAAEDLALNFADVPGAPCASCVVYDVWARAPIGTFDSSYTAAAV